MKSFLVWLALAAMATAGGASAQPSREQIAAETFADAQMATGSRAAVAFAQSAVRSVARDPQLADLVRRRQDAEQRWRAVDSARAAALATSGEGPRAKASALNGQLRAIEGEIVALQAELARRFPAFAELTDPSPLALADAQRLLRPDEALVLVVPAFDGVYVWALRPDRTVWFRGALDERGIEARVALLREALSPPAALQPRAFPRAEAFDLYREIWAPADEALDGARMVYVVAGGPLAALPMSVLPTAPPQGDDRDPAALRATPWLFQRYALATLPSVSSLRLIRALPEVRRAAEPFAGFGDPLLDGPESGQAPRGFDHYFRGASADLEALRALPRLPGARGELLAMAAALGAPEGRVVTGAAATEAKVRAADLSRTRVVAFATHGLLAGEIDGVGEPGLVLTPGGPEAHDDGLLTASEAAQLRLAADWVVLSACNTAASDEDGVLQTAGEGLSGLARAFFYAGGRALLVSHWRVRDDAAAALTTGAITAHAAAPELGRASALQAAMAKVLADESRPEFAHPAYWGPFVVAGDGS